MTDHDRSRYQRLLAALGAACLLGACATTSGGGSGAGYGPPPIPEGKGRLILEGGGVPDLNFFVEDQETGEIVHEDMQRASAFSPSSYERTWSSGPQMADLDPGTYDVTVNTDIDESVVVRDVVVQMGQEVYVPVRVGRVQMIISGGQGFTSQIPFLFMDYNMRSVLGKGMTSSELKYFILPVGRYKIRLENSPSGVDEHRSLDVVFGRSTPVTIDLGSSEEGPEQPQQGQQP